MAHLVNRVLETIWNKTALMQSPIHYFLFPKGKNKVVVKEIVIEGKLERVIFVSKQLHYSRTGKLLKRKARLYRVEVIITSTNELDNHPSKIFMVPELCGGIFKNTLIPHSCAVNFVISMITLTQ